MPTGISDEQWQAGVLNQGQAVGYYWDSGGAVHGFRDYNNGFSSVDFSPGGATLVWGINNTVQMAGEFYGNMSSPTAFFDSVGNFSSFSYPGATDTFAGGVNDADQIAGIHSDAAGLHGFVYNYGGDGSFASFEFPGGPNPSLATAFVAFLNGDTQVVSTYYDSNSSAHGLLYNAGSDQSSQTLDYFYGQSTWATGINNNGQVVGYYADASGLVHGFLYSNGAFTPFDCPQSACPGLVETYVDGVNDQGQIVGHYLDSTVNHYAFLATPPQ